MEVLLVLLALWLIVHLISKIDVGEGSSSTRRKSRDDYLVRGRGPKTIQTVRDIAGFEYFKVTSANYNRFGSNPHIKVVGA